MAVAGARAWCMTCGPVKFAQWEKEKHPRDASGHFSHTQDAPTSRGSRYKSADPGSTDPGVQRALGLLTGDDAPPDVSRVAVSHQHALRGSPQVSAAWTDPQEHMIYVNDQSRAYKDAAKGRGQELAAALAHEQYHMDHGADEGPAYDHQITVLQRLGAKSSLVNEIRRARTAVTGEQR